MTLTKISAVLDFTPLYCTLALIAVSLVISVKKVLPLWLIHHVPCCGSTPPTARSFITILYQGTASRFLSLTITERDARTHWIETVCWYVMAKKKISFYIEKKNERIAPDKVAVLTELVWLMSLNKLIQNISLFCSLIYRLIAIRGYQNTKICNFHIHNEHFVKYCVLNYRHRLALLLLSRIVLSVYKLIVSERVNQGVCFCAGG